MSLREGWAISHFPSSGPAKAPLPPAAYKGGGVGQRPHMVPAKAGEHLHPPQHGGSGAGRHPKGLQLVGHSPRSVDVHHGHHDDDHPHEPKRHHDVLEHPSLRGSTEASPRRSAPSSSSSVPRVASSVQGLHLGAYQGVHQPHPMRRPQTADATRTLAGEVDTSVRDVRFEPRVTVRVHQELAGPPGGGGAGAGGRIWFKQPPQSLVAGIEAARKNGRGGTQRGKKD